jgi:xanthine dehydrogenase YagR molybdenum-binding subunit
LVRIPDCTAGATYPGLTTPAIAQLKVTEDGEVVISIGGHEMGQGIRTALANAVSRKIGVHAEKVGAVIGDTRAAPQHLTAGSWARPRPSRRPKTLPTAC